MIRRFAFVLALVAACGLVAAPAGAKGGNSTSAKLCQKGGWTHLYRADGSTFSSETACTSYAAQGGTLLTAPPASIVMTADTYDCGGTCFGSFVASGLAATSEYLIWGTINGISHAWSSGATSPTGVAGGQIGFSCGRGWTDVYVTGTTAAGDPIESNHIDSPCG